MLKRPISFCYVPALAEKILKLGLQPDLRGKSRGRVRGGKRNRNREKRKNGEYKRKDDQENTEVMEKYEDLV